MPAVVTNHIYHDGYSRRDLDRTFHMVECVDCLIVLNSGHHYPADARHLAQKLADEHNAEHHPS